MDNTAYATLARVKRPHGPVTLAGGTVVHVRQLTIGELRRLETEAEAAPEDERGIRYSLLLAAHGLCDAGGESLYPSRPPREEDFSALEDIFTPEQLRQIGNAAAGSRTDAKN